MRKLNTWKPIQMFSGHSDAKNIMDRVNASSRFPKLLPKYDFWEKLKMSRDIFRQNRHLPT